MAFKDLMIDLETMGNRPNSAVISIGAVFFDIETGELGETFEATIELADALRYGQVDGDTLKWWLGQGEAARKALVSGKHDAVFVWDQFYKYSLKYGDNIQPWGNGSSFDITMCQWQIGRVLGKREPWKFWNVQDCRTIKRAAAGIVPYDDTFNGVAHRALDDAIHQAKYVSAYWQGLRKVKSQQQVSTSAEDDFILDLE